MKGATFTLAICMLIVSLAGQVMSADQTSTTVRSAGVVRTNPVEDYYVFLRFESDDEFKIGKYHGTSYVEFNIEYPCEVGGWNTPWDRGGFDFTNPIIRADVETSIVHGGTRSLKIQLQDPSYKNPGYPPGKRLNMIHDWEPYAEHRWLEAWFYIPEDFPDLGWGRGTQGTKIMAINSERYWGPGDRPYYFFNGPGIRLWLDIYRGTNHDTYGKWVFLSGLGRGGGPSLPPDDPYNPPPDVIFSDAQLFYNPSTGRKEWDPSIDPNDYWIPPFGQWFMIRQHIYKNYADINNGLYQCWLSLPPDYQEELVFETTYRCAGILPDGVEGPGTWRWNTEQVTWTQSSYGMAYQGAGIALYCDGDYNDDGIVDDPPHHIYVDDVIFSSEGTFTPPG